MGTLDELLSTLCTIQSGASMGVGIEEKLYFWHITYSLNKGARLYQWELNMT